MFIYLIGCLIAFILIILSTKKYYELTIGMLVSVIFFSLLSWVSIITILLYELVSADFWDKPISFKKNK